MAKKGRHVYLVWAVGHVATPWLVDERSPNRRNICPRSRDASLLYFSSWVSGPKLKLQHSTPWPAAPAVSPLATGRDSVWVAGRERGSTERVCSSVEREWSRRFGCRVLRKRRCLFPFAFLLQVDYWFEEIYQPCIDLLYTCLLVKR